MDLGHAHVHMAWFPTITEVFEHVVHMAIRHLDVAEGYKDLLRVYASAVLPTMTSHRQICQTLKYVMERVNTTKEGRDQNLLVSIAQRVRGKSGVLEPIAAEM